MALSTKKQGKVGAKQGKAKGRGRPLGSTKKAAAKVKPSRAKRGTVARQGMFKRKNWAKRLVFLGKKAKTSTGLAKRDLVKNKRGMIVSKRRSAIGRKRYHENHIDLWTQSLMETREDKQINGWMLCKKAGTKAERELFQSTRLRWKEAVRDRMVHMVQKLDTQGQQKILSQLAGAGGRDASSGASASASGGGDEVEVKEEQQFFKQGDRVKMKKNGPSSLMRGQVGVVERYQLGRWCINFGGDLKAVKPEQLERVS